MIINTKLQERSNQICELCGNQDESLHAYAVPPKTGDNIDDQVILCTDCFDQIVASNYSNVHHWRCLEGSIWSEVPAVKVLSYKIMSKLTDEEWAQDAKDSAFLEEELVEWANAEDFLEAAKVIHKDSFGVILEAGDTVILTQNLNVKGTNYIAPKGTIVRKIKLVHENAEQIEGKINGDTIVILTRFVKKAI